MHSLPFNLMQIKYIFRCLFIVVQIQFGILALTYFVDGQEENPAKLQCGPGQGLHIVGLSALDADLRTIPHEMALDLCRAIPTIEQRVGDQCEGLESCLVDLQALDATQVNCPALPYLSIDVFCSNPESVTTVSSAPGIIS